ncbi:Zinc/iron permease [Coemansia reversa NRRL 1564]|uniref:Zinc/iron permease n=1 Tax=Coemansia reversa (strain ATCC 12441 / NRRL 1564) TaxID=763665 RepID=A0A2G5B752_COERN|nr:Zinc/iron permease [Coemansia reversa NRRL 1564]|eukprot:PIA14557.1 Zinc/iron permease [Coemansia reversa NRRL 1564]
MAGKAECDISGLDTHWDKNWHIVALFTIIGTSAAGVFLPIILQTIRGINQLALPNFPIQLGQFFGAGIIIATAFLHLFPAATEALSNPCLGGFAESYSAWAWLIAMTAVFSIHSIEWWLVEAWIGHKVVRNFFKDHTDMKAPSKGITATEGDDDSTTIHSKSFSMPRLSLPVEVKRRALATHVLEVGIALYSVLIGLALAISDSGFIALFIAICFHQFFEGLALAHHAIEVDGAGLTSHNAWLSALGFCATTPTGIIIGLALHNIYEPHSKYAFLLNGVLQSICTGILVYAGLVTLMIGGFNSAQVKQMPRLYQVLLFFAVYAGAAVMASLKIWK